MTTIMHIVLIVTRAIAIFVHHEIKVMFLQKRYEMLMDRRCGNQVLYLQGLYRIVVHPG